jgi:pimeloyl-ACP methyl ester carboxylesterase
MAPVARELADSFRVLEPWQRGSGGEPLTVARHIEDLRLLIEDACPTERPALVGHSWGAMLALSFAASHPRHARALVLVGCGTFDPESRRRTKETTEARMDSGFRHRLEKLQEKYPDPDRRLAARGALMMRLQSFDLIKRFGRRSEEEGPYDARAHQETWSDMLRLQEEGVYPAAFAAIDSPVLMLHGSYDPHPGGMIRAGLAPYIPRLEYKEWDRCGHYPWLEKAARREFFLCLKEWLARKW